MLDHQFFSLVMKNEFILLMDLGILSKSKVHTIICFIFFFCFGETTTTTGDIKEVTIDSKCFRIFNSYNIYISIYILCSRDLKRSKDEEGSLGLVVLIKEPVGLGIILPLFSF